MPQTVEECFIPFNWLPSFELSEFLVSIISRRVLIIDVCLGLVGNPRRFEIERSCPACIGACNGHPKGTHLPTDDCRHARFLLHTPLLVASHVAFCDTSIMYTELLHLKPKVPVTKMRVVRSEASGCEACVSEDRAAKFMVLIRIKSYAPLLIDCAESAKWHPLHHGAQSVSPF